MIKYLVSGLAVLFWGMVLSGHLMGSQWDAAAMLKIGIAVIGLLGALALAFLPVDRRPLSVGMRYRLFMGVPFGALLALYVVDQVLLA